MGSSISPPLIRLPAPSPRKRGEDSSFALFAKFQRRRLAKARMKASLSPFTGRDGRQASEGRRGVGKFLAVTLVIASTLSLAACQSEPKPSGGGSGKSAALRTMEQVSIAAHKCWFASKDAAFKSYRFANELNSMSGQPRFLLVPAKNFGGLPALVVQARGNSSQVEVFGPLLSEPLGSRISSDINRWRSGDSSCGASA
jgi:hypothetical protein